MGVDKSMLEYHGSPQREYLYELLSTICEDVFLACNKERQNSIPSQYKIIPDEPTNAGPMEALLGAFRKSKESSFLVIGCDYPFIQIKHLKELIDERSAEWDAVCFKNPESGFDEPLIAIYEQSCSPALSEFHKTGNTSLRFFLKEIRTKSIKPQSPEILQSVDTKADFESALVKINQK